jgi:hypothetical protein
MFGFPSLLMMQIWALKGQMDGWGLPVLSLVLRNAFISDSTTFGRFEAT